MRTTLTLSEDAFLVAKQVAARERISLGDAVSQLVRAGVGALATTEGHKAPLRGRFALLPARDEVVTPDHVRALMAREGI